MNACEIEIAIAEDFGYILNNFNSVIQLNSTKEGLYFIRINSDKFDYLIEKIIIK